MSLTNALTVHEAAARLNRSSSAIALWRRAGFGPPWERKGRTILYSLLELEAWMAEHQEQLARRELPR